MNHDSIDLINLVFVRDSLALLYLSNQISSQDVLIDPSFPSHPTCLNSLTSIMPRQPEVVR